MVELLNMGKRIRHFRMLRGMTQKALGIAVGFPQETADIRIAQYESGMRTPKQGLVCFLAQALDVSPFALAIPRIKSGEELCHLLFALEDECGLVLYTQPVDSTGEINESLANWQRQRARLDTGEISRIEYDRWRYGYPDTVNTAKRKSK